MARDTRLPLSGTSTHKSVSPLELILKNAPVVGSNNSVSTTDASYDGSTKITIDLSQLVAGSVNKWGSAVGGVSQPIYFDSNGTATIATDVFAKSVGGTITAETIFNANVRMNSSATIDSLTAGSLVVSGNTSLVNTTNTQNVYPNAHNTYSLGSSALQYKYIYADEFHGKLKGNADTASKLADTNIGSTTKHIYVDSTGTFKASDATVGASNKPIWLNAGEISAVSESFGGPNQANNTFTLMYINAGVFTTAGTSVGSASKPVYMDSGTIKEITSLDASIVAAKATAYSGGAVGSENRAIYLDTSGLPQQTNAMFVLQLDNTVTGVTTFNANATFNSSVNIDSLTAGSLIVTGNTSLVNTTTTAAILPKTHNTYDIGSNAVKYKEVYAANFRGTADTAAALTSGYGSESLPIYVQSNGTPASITSLDIGSGAIKTTGTATLKTIKSTTGTFKNLNVTTSGGSFNYGTIGTGSANADHYLWYAKTGAVGTPMYDTGLKYNPSTHTLETTNFKGALTGNASTSTYFNDTKTIKLTGDVTGSTTTNFNGETSMATSYNGTVPVNKGGTNITSYTKGDILYASDTTTISKLALTTTANAILVADTTNKAPVWRTNVTVSTSAMTLTNTTLSVGSSVDTQGTTDANAAVVVSGGASIAKTVSAKEMQVADHVNLHYDSATESLNFIFN